MSFNICPFETLAKIIFKGHEPLLNKKRLQISERARQLRQNLTLTPEQTEKFNRLKEFELAGNRFFASIESRSADRQFVPNVLFHYASLFQSADIKMTIKDTPQDSISTLIRVFQGPADFTGEPYFSIEFDLYANENLIWLKSINSKYRSLGGKSIATLYNLAKDLSADKIQFRVYLFDSLAHRFYYHMDFGRPIETGSDIWQVKVI